MQGWTGEVSKDELGRLQGMVHELEAKIEPLERERRQIKGQMYDLRAALASQKWGVKIGDVVMVQRRVRCGVYAWVEARVAHIAGYDAWEDRRPDITVHMKLKGGSWSMAHRNAFSSWLTVAEWEQKGKPETNGVPRVWG